MTQEALKLALDALETELSIDWTNNDEFNALAEKMHEAIVAIKAALAQPEPVAWRTFDGEGGYDYRSYEDNESYADDWSKRNPNHAGWVDKLYTHSQRTFVGLTDEEMRDLWSWSATSEAEKTANTQQHAFARAIEAKLKEKNFA